MPNWFHKICSFFVKMYLILNLYRIWSPIYRFVWERKYKNYPTALHTDWESLEIFVRAQVWTVDGWKQLWDAISYPGTVQYKSEHDHKIGDCDEFAIYLVHSINKAKEQGYFPEVESAQFMTICWTHGWHFEGHNVCLITWQNGSKSYMDYAWPSENRDTVEEVVQDVIHAYNGDKGKLLAWSVIEENLKHVTAGN